MCISLRNQLSMYQDTQCSYVSETRILRNTICSLNLPGWGVGGGAGKSVEGEETPDLFNLYINFLSVTSFVAFFFFKKRRRRRRRRSRRRSMAIKIFCVPTSHLISHVLSDFSSSSPISPQYRSKLLTLQFDCLRGVYSLLCTGRWKCGGRRR